MNKDIELRRSRFYFYESESNKFFTAHRDKNGIIKDKRIAKLTTVIDKKTNQPLFYIESKGKALEFKITLDELIEIFGDDIWITERIEEFSGRSYLANKFIILTIPNINFHIELPPQKIELKNKKFQILSEDLILEEYSNELKIINSYDEFYLNLYYNNPMRIIKKLYGSRFEFFKDCYYDLIKEIGFSI